MTEAPVLAQPCFISMYYCAPQFFYSAQLKAAVKRLDRYLFFCLAEKNEGVDEEQRDQETHRPSDIAEKAGHFDLVLFRYGTHHEIGRVADIGIGSHKHRARGYGQQDLRPHNAHRGGHPLGKAQGTGRGQEDQVGGGVI